MADDKNTRNAVIGAVAVILAACIPIFGPQIFSSSCVVKGRVTDTDGNPIAKAIVKVDESGVSIQTTTNESGDYVLPPIESNDLKKASRFLASAPGYSDRREILSPVPSKVTLPFILKQSTIKPTRSEPENVTPPVRKELAFLQSEPPTIAILRHALEEFKREPGMAPNLDEAARMLQFLGIRQLSLTGPDFVSGMLPTGYEVTIWNSAYNDKTRYSVRFGVPSPGRPYFGRNETYFRVPE